MSHSVKNIKIKQRSDTLVNWTINNPILLKNEIGYELDTKGYRIGDGVSNYTDLPYFSIGHEENVVVLDIQIK